MTVETTIEAGTSQVRLSKSVVSSATWTYDINKGQLTIHMTAIMGFPVGANNPIDGGTVIAPFQDNGLVDCLKDKIEETHQRMTVMAMIDLAEKYFTKEQAA